jgi:hypothetical protein
MAGGYSIFLDARVTKFPIKYSLRLNFLLSRILRIFISNFYTEFLLLKRNN